MEYALCSPHTNTLCRTPDTKHPNAFKKKKKQYYLQYKNVRPEYLKQVWGVVNWKDVAARYAAAKK